MENSLKKIIEKNRKFAKEGKVANYIPALSAADENHIGVCLSDINGKLYKYGDYNVKFTIQSISKVLSLMLAIMDNGHENVFKRVGYESTDEPFNTMYKLDFDHINKPANPMINSGAIVTSSLIKGEGKEKFNRLLDLIREITENPDINYNKEVFLSEKKTGDKNRAIAYLMNSKSMIHGDVEEILDNYFKQCSIEMDVVDLSKIGSFLAGNWRNTRFSYDIYKNKISGTLVGLMLTCGMYNFSSEYAIKVGIPSKSGVSGGLLGTIPGSMGIGVYSPPLDNKGNSIVGYNIMKDLAKKLEANLLLK